MIPKSTAKLQEGDFCLIQREDGKFVPFVYVAKQGSSRSYFYGGIANIILESQDIDNLPNNIDISEYALLHIKCFKENETPIIGNLKNKLKNGTLNKIIANVTDTSVGSKSSVWGYKTISKYANNVDA